MTCSFAFLAGLVSVDKFRMWDCRDNKQIVGVGALQRDHPKSCAICVPSVKILFPHAFCIGICSSS